MIGEKQKECNSVYEAKAGNEHSPLYYADDLVEIETKRNKIDKSKLEIKFENKIFNVNSGISGPFWLQILNTLWVQF